MERMRGREGELVLVNGQYQPMLEARPGERERWRIVNACTSRYLWLRLDGQQVQLLGVDSGRLPRPRDVQEVVLATGNRADLLVTSAAGTSRLTAQAYDRGSMMDMGSGMGSSSASAGDDAAVLATVAVTGAAVPALPGVPAQPALRDLRTEPVTTTRELNFAMGMAGGGMAFTIDGKEFDPDRMDQTPRFGTVEEWKVRNTSTMDHPLHLHVWPMQLIEQGGQPLEEPTWQDVVDVPARSHITVRIAFDRFAGRTVYHCHILDHEDNGMMAVVQTR